MSRKKFPQPILMHAFTGKGKLVKEAWTAKELSSLQAKGWRKLPIAAIAA